MIVGREIVNDNEIQDSYVSPADLEVLELHLKITLIFLIVC